MQTQTRVTIDEDDFANEDYDYTAVTGPFNCLLCLGVSVMPVKCETCDQVYCLECLYPKNTKPNKNGDYVFECYKKCGSKKLAKLTRIESNILNGLNFHC